MVPLRAVMTRLGQSCDESPGIAQVLARRVGDHLLSDHGLFGHGLPNHQHE
jgi:hypothetical protein